MNNEFDELDNLFGSASGDLRNQLDDIDIPEFQPRNDRARALVVVAVLAVAAFFGLPWLADAFGETTSIDTAEIVDDGTVEPAPDPEEAPDEVVEVPGAEAIDLITGFDTTPPVDGRERLSLGESVPDPAYGANVRRVSEAGPAEARIASSFASPENADSTALLILRNEADWHAVDRTSLESTELSTVDRRSEPHWHPTNPSVLRHFPDPQADTGLALLETSLDGSTEVVADLATRVIERFPTAVFLSSGVGQDPALGTIYAWAVLNEGSDLLGFISYDLSLDQILGSADAPTEDFGNFDSVRISPSGTFVIAGWVDNTVSYDVSFAESTVLDQRNRDGALVVMEGASDALITVDLTSEEPTGGHIYWIDLESGERNLLYDLFDGANTSVQFSASPQRPGWAILATHGCRGAGAWSCEKVMATHLVSGTLVNLAHTYACGEAALSVPQISVSPALDRAYFNSDSATCDQPAEAFEVEIPSNLFELAE